MHNYFELITPTRQFSSARNSVGKLLRSPATEGQSFVVSRSLPPPSIPTIPSLIKTVFCNWHQTNIRPGLMIMDSWKARPLGFLIAGTEFSAKVFGFQDYPQACNRFAITNHEPLPQTTPYPKPRILTWTTRESVFSHIYTSHKFLWTFPEAMDQGQTPSCQWVLKTCHAYTSTMYNRMQKKHSHDVWTFCLRKTASSCMF